MTARILGTVAVLLAAPCLQAADASGAFAIKGAGLQTCGSFLDAWDSGSADLSLYGGWIDGYLTGANQHFEDTFDIAPWQSTQGLLGLTKLACDQAGRDGSFARAFDNVIRLLLPARLTEGSTAEAVRRGETSLIIYTSVVQRVQKRLDELGIASLQPSGTFDEATAAALESYQREHGLEPTGLPDERTMYSLFLR